MSSTCRTRMPVAAAIAALGSSVALGACGGADKTGSNPTTTARSAASGPSIPPPNWPKRRPAPRPKPTKPARRGAAAPATTSGNRWYPLTPGIQTVREGAVNVGHRRLPHRLITTVSGITKVIDGVRATAVLDQDVNGGEITEESLDFFATDRQGNVRYYGTYTEHYEGGQFVFASDAWLSGTNGAQVGTWVPAQPRAGSSAFYEENVPGSPQSTGQVIKTGLHHCVPYKCYDGVIVVQEGEEYKYYAPGVGHVRTAPQGGAPQEVEQLVNFTRLTPGGLAQVDAEVLKMDRRARSQRTDVFGRSQPAKRTV